MGTGVAVGRSVGPSTTLRVAVSGGATGDGGIGVSVGNGSGAGELHAAMIKDKKMAKKIVRRIGLFYCLWGAS